MNMLRNKNLIVCVLAVFPAVVSGQEKPPLYRTTLIQAAPGKLLDLIDLLKTKAAADRQIGEPVPFWMRHSQGDSWDLMLLTPLGSYEETFSSQRSTKREEAERAFGWRHKFEELIALREELFVLGPPAALLAKAFDGGGFFHVEMFIALPNKHAELVRQREMENTYFKALGRPENFIFVRDQGSSWDLFTLGIYRNLKHYAESADVPEDKSEAAAKAAGFTSASQIGPYLRTLIRTHHDTLAVAIR